MMNFLYQFSNWKLILPLSIFFLVFMFVIFPVFQSDIQEIANEQVQSLDGRIAYTLEDVINLFDKIGSQGRDIYKFISGRIDMVYPIVYGLLFVLLLANALKDIIKAQSKLIYFSLFPVLGVICDYIENIFIINFLNSFPIISIEKVAIGSFITTLKWLFLFLTIVLVLILSSMRLIKYVKKRMAGLQNS